MAKRNTKESATDIYHVVTRGVNRRVLFEDENDRLRYLDYLVDSLGEHGGRLLAWCLMTNHVHLLVSIEFGHLPDFMRRLNHGYARYFNSKYDRVGHLFQGRFWSEAVETEEYLLTVTRYVHQNPVKALMTSDCNYRWSSYGQYAGNREFEICDTSTVMGAFGDLSGFLEFHSTLSLEDTCLEIKLQMSDEEAFDYASEIIGAEKLCGLRDAGKAERDACLRIMKSCMIPRDQIASIAGVSESMVDRA